MTTKKGKKVSGGRYRKSRKKKLSEYKGQPRVVVLGSEKRKKIRVRAGHVKTVLLTTDKANLINQETKKAQVVKIKNVLEVPSNKFLARRNILIKGALIETEAGKAKITNRPSQEGNVQAVLVS